jgi:5-methylcytosine-specific restriction protein A
MTKVEDKKRLKKAAEEVADVLKSNFSGSNLNFCNELQIESSSYDGWFCSITNDTRTIPRFEVYLDFLTGKKKRQFYYGFAANKKPEIENLVDIFENSTGKKISNKTITIKNINEKDGKFSIDKALLNEIEFPIREFYGTQRQYYFGAYVIRDAGPLSGIPLKKIIDFFSHFSITFEINSELEGFRGRVTHEILQRATAIVREFVACMTAKGRLRCQLCEFDPKTKVAGTSVHPRSLLDVHHKKPLSEGERDTRIEDLQLLCPTCHRFAHAKMRIK